MNYLNPVMLDVLWGLNRASPLAFNFAPVLLAMQFITMVAISVPEKIDGRRRTLVQNLAGNLVDDCNRDSEE